jgi:anaerobic magnesium-protoporphyrin IX monomethyl ester cyclase
MQLTLRVERILFIIPPNITFGEFVFPPPNVKHAKKADGRISGSMITDIPLGPLTLSAYLKKYIKLESKLIDFNVVLNREDAFYFLSFRDYFRSFLSEPTVGSFRPTIIGISAQFAPSYQNAIP